MLREELTKFADEKMLQYKGRLERQVRQRVEAEVPAVMGPQAQQLRENIAEAFGIKSEELVRSLQQ